MLSQRQVPCCVVPVHALGLASGSAQSPSMEAPKTNSKIWVGRYHEIEEYLKTAECVSIERLGALLGRCILRPGGPVARMAWRSLPRDLPRFLHELQKSNRRIRARQASEDGHGATHRRTTAPRQHRAATLWVEKARDVKGRRRPPRVSRIAWDKQLARMTMFDALIGNRNRNLTNVLRDGAWN